MESRFLLSASSAVLPMSGTLYEAETATLSGFKAQGTEIYPQIENDYKGFDGTGYVNMSYDNQSTLTWSNVQAATAGAYTLTFRYAIGGMEHNRPLELKVNGATVNASLGFLNTGGWAKYKTVSIQVTLHAGTNSVELLAHEFLNPHIDSMLVAPSTSPRGNLYQAETATLGGFIVPDNETYPQIENQYKGFDGTGYVNMSYDNQATLTWSNVQAATAGTYTLTFRYAIGGMEHNRPLELQVSGATVKASLDFLNTGGWSKYKTVSIQVTLQAGKNSIELLAHEFLNPHIDSMLVTASGALRGTLYQAETATLGGFKVRRGGSKEIYPQIENQYQGFDGTGYVNMSYDNQATLTWSNVQVATAGTYTLAFRYAIGGMEHNRPLELQVNGATVNSSLAFLNTGGWSKYKTVSVQVKLQAGNNSVELLAHEFLNPHIDSMLVTN